MVCVRRGERWAANRRTWEAPGRLLCLLTRQSSFSEDQNRARVVPIQNEQRQGGKDGAGVRFRACESSRQGATATLTASLPTPCSQLPLLRPIGGVGARARLSIQRLQLGLALMGGGRFQPSAGDLNTQQRGYLPMSYSTRKSPFGASAGVYLLACGSSRDDLHDVRSLPSVEDPVSSTDI